jgi:hypothetical protein
MNRLSSVLNSVLVGQPQNHANMSVYPLYIKNGHQRGYQTLDEAIQAKTLDVTEANEGGSVPTLKVKNTGTLPVLLVVGEELIGAKQNRVLNTSLLVPAEQEMNIPVSCVEQGRWSYSSRQFSSSPTTSHLELRFAQVKNVTKNLEKRNAYDSDQGAVWGEVSRKMSAHDSSSRTMAMHDMYDQQEDKLKGYLDALQPRIEADNAPQGMLVAINGEVVGADIFDHPTTLQSLWPKLMRSYALGALERQGKDEATKPLEPERIQQFLTTVQTVPEKVYDSVGLGKDVRLDSEEVAGSGLLWDDKLIHASVYNSKAASPVV